MYQWCFFFCQQYTQPSPDAFRVLRGHQLSITCLCISSDDKFVFSGSKDCSIIKCNVVTFCFFLFGKYWFLGVVFLVIGTSDSEKNNLHSPKKSWTNDLVGLFVWRPISANPGLHFNTGFFFFCSKAFSWVIFSILWRVSNLQIVEKKN